MIARDKIVRLVTDKLDEGRFIVEVTVSPANQIVVLLDGDNGITIDDCIRVSRYIESNLDREEEDFELQVSSAGLGQPLRLYRQYVKNTGKEIEVVLKNGQKHKGILKNVTETGFDLEVSNQRKGSASKNKQQEIQLFRVAFEETKTVRNVLKF